jgi:NADH-quinone oxidoreductase subunit G
VILWGERFTAGPDGAERARALLDIAASLSLGDVEGAGLLEIPATANGRGLREAGVLPNGGLGLRDAEVPGLDTQGIAEGLTRGDLSALYLVQVDPLSASDPFAAGGPGDSAWQQSLERASTVVAHATVLTDGIHEHANVVFPAESYAEKEGTVTHPDGRVQRVRQAVARSGSKRAGWQVIAELAERLGLDLGVRNEKMASEQLFDAVPFYAGLTLEEIGGRGVRWQERPQASAYSNGDPGSAGEMPSRESAYDDRDTASAGAEQVPPNASAHSGPDIEMLPPTAGTDAEDRT